jgi:hypothetical protein
LLAAPAPRHQAGRPLAALAPPGAAPLLWAAELLAAPLGDKLGQLFDNAAPAGGWECAGAEGWGWWGLPGRMGARRRGLPSLAADPLPRACARAPQGRLDRPEWLFTVVTRLAREQGPRLEPLQVGCAFLGARLRRGRRRP